MAIKTIEEIVNETHEAIHKYWSQQSLNEFFLCEYNDNSLIQYHHGLGRWIRNTFALWSIPWEPELIDGIDHSPYHPDELSMTIIKEVWKKGPKNDC